VSDNTDIAYSVEGELSLKDAIQADLTRLRAKQMRFAERLDRAAEKEERSERLAQLNNAAVKTARAVRQIAVLQLEIAGERPLPNVRTPPAPAPPTRTKPSFCEHGPRPSPKPWEEGDYTDYDDYTVEESEWATEMKVNNQILRLEVAMDADFRAAGREDVCREAPILKFKLIMGIPHPAFDACQKTVDLALLCHFLGEENLQPLALLPDAPDGWAEYDEMQRLHGGPRARDTS
jgi:hypothetical protein